MASSKFRYLGGFSGKIGPYVFYVSGDKQIVRSNSVPRDPKTPAQLAQRAKVSIANKGLSPLCQIIKQGYGNDAGAYRRLVGKTIREFVVGEYPNLSIDYSKIEISNGKLLLPDKIETAFLPESRHIEFRWDADRPERSNRCHTNDSFHVVFMEKETGTVEIGNCRAKRREGRALVPFPDRLQPSEAHCWVYFRSDNYEHCSKSLYLTL